MFCIRLFLFKQTIYSINFHELKTNILRTKNEHYVPGESVKNYENERETGKNNLNTNNIIEKIKHLKDEMHKI